LRLRAPVTIASTHQRNYLGDIGAKKPHVKTGTNNDASPNCCAWCGLMEFGGRYRIAADRMAVWSALNDPSMLKAAIPGCSLIDWSGADQLDLEITVNLGIVKPVFRGELTLSNILPAQSYTLSGKGKGGMLGLAEGSADIVLEDVGAGQTLLAFTAHGGASGQLMRMGKAVIGNSAQRIIDGFFERFANAMGVGITPLEPVDRVE
jgi:carbon monoxide dehydrogenase subunit G